MWVLSETLLDAALQPDDDIAFWEFCSYDCAVDYQEREASRNGRSDTIKQIDPVTLQTVWKDGTASEFLIYHRAGEVSGYWTCPNNYIHGG
jgi:hypothetical protein